MIISQVLFYATFNNCIIIYCEIVSADNVLSMGIQYSVFGEGI